MSIKLLRASHANVYELQNYQPIAQKYDISVITSFSPLTNIPLPYKRCFSFTDLPNFPYRRQLLNRLIGGEQWLIGLDRQLDFGDVVHTAETYTPYTHQAVTLRKHSYINKLICTCWETIPHNNEKFGRLRRWKEEAYQYVDLFHVPTLLAKNALLAEGVGEDKICVIPYGVDTTRFTPGRSHSQHRPVIITVARTVPEKGLRIWEKLVDEFATLADFRWVTGVSYDNMPQVYQQADIFLLLSQSTPTWEEQYGMALLEAMASGLPILATQTGAIPEVLGNAGILVNPSDYSGISHHLSSLIADLSLRTHLARRALLRSRKFALDKISPRLARLYQ